jgi:putative transcriptional regulator
LTINHHLDPATIMSFAAGTIGEALGFVAASHIAWCPECRAALQEAESLGGEIFAGLAPETVSAGCRARTLGRLDDAPLAPPLQSRQPRVGVPMPLQRLLGGAALSEVNWKSKAPGLALHDLPLSPGAKGKLLLMRIAPGKAMPAHGHGGEEMTLILEGAYNDSLGRFAKGDVADLDDHIEHKPIVETGMACICLVATEAPTRFKSWPARLAQPFIGI